MADQVIDQCCTRTMQYCGACKREFYGPAMDCGCTDGRGKKRIHWWQFWRKV